MVKCCSICGYRLTKIMVIPIWQKISEDGIFSQNFWPRIQRSTKFWPRIQRSTKFSLMTIFLAFQFLGGGGQGPPLTRVCNNILAHAPVDWRVCNNILELNLTINMEYLDTICWSTTNLMVCTYRQLLCKCAYLKKFHLLCQKWD